MKMGGVVPMGRIELPTSPLPRECSTTEPHGRFLMQQILERDKRIELLTEDWKSAVLPLN